MDKFFRLALLVTLLSATIFCRAAEGGPSPQQPELEDAALLNVLDHRGYLHFLAVGDTAQLQELVDVNLNKHLTALREHREAIRDEASRAGEIRALNAIALLWEQRPPFQSQSWQPTEMNAFWLPRWRETHEKNLQLLRWARMQCAKRPDLKCRTQSPTPKQLESQ